MDWAENTIHILVGILKPITHAHKHVTVLFNIQKCYEKSLNELLLKLWYIINITKKSLEAGVSPYYK